MNPGQFLPLAERLYFTGGVAEAESEIIAFDRALQECGIHDANVLEVSSVVPEGAEMVEGDAEQLESMIEPGGFYPVVVSRETSSKTGEHIFAAVGGCKFDSGYGVNVEIHGSDVSRKEARRRCMEMLQDMADRRGEEIDGEMMFEYNSAEVEETCCVISAVVYGRE